MVDQLVAHPLWAYLSSSPLTALTVTLFAYWIGQTLYERCNRYPLLNPVAIAIGLLVLLLYVTDIPYSRYFEGAQFIHFLLGPATVALAVPLYLHIEQVRQLFIPLLITLVVGSLTAIVSAMWITQLLGGSKPTILSMAPKSVTTPVAMGIAEKIGGLPALTAVIVILTGIIGAMMASTLLRVLAIQNDSIKGFAIGLTAHGIGTARAFQMSELAGAFSGLAMGLNALLTTLLVPIVVHWFF